MNKTPQNMIYPTTCGFIKRMLLHSSKIWYLKYTPEALSICALQGLQKNVSRIVKNIHSFVGELQELCRFFREIDSCHDYISPW